MDLSKLNQLDPKLKETYERVMGTSTTPIQPQPIPQSVQPARPQPIAQSQPFQPQPIQKQQAQTLKKKNKVLPIFLALGGIIFLIGYAFFWTKFFNLKLPFLPF